MQNKSIIRVQKNRENPYVMMNKKFLSDDRMSWKAKGILSYLLSKPDDWKVIVSDLVKRSKDGRDAVYSGLKELEKNGYMERYPVKNKEGKITHWENIIYEEPVTENPEMDKSPLTENPDVDNPDMEKPHMENPSLLINYSSNNDDTNNKVSQSEKQTDGLTALEIVKKAKNEFSEEIVNIVLSEKMEKCKANGGKAYKDYLFKCCGELRDRIAVENMAKTAKNKPQSEENKTECETMTEQEKRVINLFEQGSSEYDITMHLLQLDSSMQVHEAKKIIKRARYKHERL